MKDSITNYRDLPVGKWAEIQALCQDGERDELERQAGVLAILADMTVDEVLDLPVVEYRRRVVDASFLTRADDAVAPRAARRYVCEPFVLVPVTDARKITTAQFIDFKEYADKGDAFIVEALSCLLVPEGCKYLHGYDIAQVQHAIGTRLSTYDAMGLAAFFLTRYAESLRHFLTYSERAAKRMKDATAKAAILEKVQTIRQTLSSSGGAGSPTSTS